MKQKKAFWILGLSAGALIFSFVPSLFADDVQNINYMERGIMRILTAGFQLPVYLIQRTVNGPPLVGTIDGALSGTYYTLSALLGGTFDIARGTVPYAKYMLFFI